MKLIRGSFLAALLAVTAFPCFAAGTGGGAAHGGAATAGAHSGARSTRSRSGSRKSGNNHYSSSYYYGGRRSVAPGLRNRGYTGYGYGYTGTAAASGDDNRHKKPNTGLPNKPDPASTHPSGYVDKIPR